MNNHETSREDLLKKTGGESSLLKITVSGAGQKIEV